MHTSSYERFTAGAVPGRMELYQQLKGQNKAIFLRGS
jgi:hypothetical protein